MPALEEGLYSYLSTELAGEVGTRIFPIRSPEGTIIPYITYQRVSAQRWYTHDPFLDDPAWVRARISFACVGSTAIEAMGVSDALILALSGFTGEMGDVHIGKSDVLTEFDLYDAETKLYRRVVDVFLDYEEAEFASS